MYKTILFTIASYGIQNKLVKEMAKCFTLKITRQVKGTNKLQMFVLWIRRLNSLR